MKKKPACAFILACPLLCAAAVNFFDPSDTGAVPKLLSQTGVYSSIASKTLDTSLKFFEVNAPLWSDGALKTRWIILPPGTHINYVDTTDLFDYPNGTRFVKLFRHERVQNDTSTGVYWETRLLVNKENAQGYDDWYGFSYQWNAQGTEARLVNPQNGFDTVFTYYPDGLSQPQSYKKWHYPSQAQCRVCHQTLFSATDVRPVSTRGILGFLPAQLKRNSLFQPGVNQITALFNQGVFTGTEPDPSQLARRWKGYAESVPNGLSSDQRFAVIDTLARSYIAANCSGCHGTRGIPVTPQIPINLNYDFFKLRPVMEFAYQGTGTYGLQGLNPDSLSLSGRNRYMASIARAGLDTSRGAIWNLDLPPGKPDTLYPSLVYPRFPSLSTLPFRITVRPAPWIDSVNLRVRLRQGDPDGYSGWIFSQPWGSAAWRDLLSQHQVELNSIISFVYDPQQMPPLASYIPDTAGLKILGEWIRNYRTLYVVDSNNIVSPVKPRATFPRNIPRIQNRVLILPEGWEGRVLMIGIQGRIYSLYSAGSAGKNRYAIPPSAPPGVYFFKAGKHYFKASLIR